MEEYDVNRNGFLEWEEYVRFFDNTFPRPTNLEIYVMRTREEGRKWADRFDRLMYPVTDKQVETAVCSRVMPPYLPAQASKANYMCIFCWSKPRSIEVVGEVSQPESN